MLKLLLIYCFEYLLVVEFRFDAMSWSVLCNENSDAGPIWRSRGPQEPHTRPEWTTQITQREVAPFRVVLSRPSSYDAKTVFCNRRHVSGEYFLFEHSEFNLVWFAVELLQSWNLNVRSEFASLVSVMKVWCSNPCEVPFSFW